MLADEPAQKPIYRPGPYWLPNQKRITKAIARYGIQRFRETPAVGKGYSDARQRTAQDFWAEQGPIIRTAKRLLSGAPVMRGIVADYDAVLKGLRKEVAGLRNDVYRAREDWFVRATAGRPLPETTVGGSAETITLRGEEYSRHYVDLLMRIHNVEKHVDLTAVRAVMEIGGGFGAFIHLLLSRYPNVRKVYYVDIPPMIYIGTQYLRHFFGDSVRDYSQTRREASIQFAGDGLEIFCLCPWQIETLESPIDFFWNSASFSEMTPPIVQNYAAHVIRLLQKDKVAALIMNKAKPGPDNTSSEEILASFGSGLKCMRFEPEVEHFRHPAYALGRK